MSKKITGGGNLNPRYKNGNLRRKHRARLKAIGGPCGICQGRLGEIHYDEPSDWKHPFSFVIDEIIPVSKWREYGYASPEAVAQDWNNLQAAHWCCNQAKRDRIINPNKNHMVGVGGTDTINSSYIERILNLSSQNNTLDNDNQGRKDIISKINVSDGSW